MELKSKRIKIEEGIYLNIVDSHKFKSNLISCYFTRPLKRDEVTKNSLLPLVLKGASNSYPTNLDIEKRLEELYGANLSVSVNKRGEKQIIRFTMEWAKSEYLDEANQDFEAIDMIKEIVFNPLLDRGVFNKEIVKREKENLRRIIEGKINDKRSYAIERCIEEMCKYENFSVYQLGYVEDIDDIDENKLYDHYLNILGTSPIEIMYVGNYSEEILKHLKKQINLVRENLVTIADDEIITSPQTKKVIREKMDVNQGKLVIGYRTGIKHSDELYSSLLVAGEILGGGPNSKLFMNVREKASLAYYIGSSILKYKSILMIDGGIEFENYDKAIEIINKQLADLKDGNFTDSDIDIAKKAIKTSTESIKDSIFLISEFFFSRELSGESRSLEEILLDFHKVTKDEIIEAAKRIEIDTIYFMENHNQEG